MWRLGAGATAGSCTILLLPVLPPWPWLAGVAGVVAVVATWHRSWWVWAYVGAALLCAHSLQRALDDRLDPALEGQRVDVRGTVVSVPQGTLEALEFRFAPDAEADGARFPGMLELTWYEAPGRVVASERLELVVKLRRPRGFANPGGYDHEARLLRERVGATGYVVGGRRLGRSADAAWRYPVLLARAAVADAVRNTLGDRPSAGIVAGLSVGLQDALSREQWLALSRSGTSHLMAISGLHVTMIAAVAAWLAARAQRWRQRYGALGAQRDAAVVAGVVAALLYSLLAGWSLPTQRTMVMLALGACALLLRRRVGIADGLGACVCIVLLLEPMAPLAPGFWLSFGAVAAILYATTGHFARPAWWRGYLHVQAVVTIGLTPLLVGSFGAVSVVSVLVNLYAIPLYTLVVVPAVLVSCAGALAWPAAGEPLLRATGTLIEQSWPLIDGPSQWPLATWSVAGLGPVAWLALGIGVVAALSPLPRSGRLAGAALVVLACLWRPPPVPDGTARVTVLDVGQGLAVVVETRRHAIVYDAGPAFRSGTDAGQLVVVPFLRHRGLRELDLLAVSHDDADHKGGAMSVASLLPVARFAVGEGVDVASVGVAGARPRSVERCRRGVRWQWDGVQFEWLHPGRGPYARDNDGSCVLIVRAGGQSLLLAGDVERAAEDEMLSAGLLDRVDVVVVPHHGSRTSSTQGFVAATHPRWVIYAAGHRNRWKFPAGDVVARWDAIGAQGLRTSTSGATTFLLDAGGDLEPEQWRLRSARPWRDP